MSILREKGRAGHFLPEKLMLRKLAFQLLLGLGLASLSGCCLYCPLFCHSCGNYYARMGYGVHGHPYSACVDPACGPAVAGGPYGAYVDPVHRARAMRIERLRQRRLARALAGQGYGPLSPYDVLCDDGLCCNDWCGCGQIGGCGDGCGGLGDEGWSSSCNCQSGSLPLNTVAGGDWSAQGWTVSPWVDVTPGPQPTPLPSTGGSSTIAPAPKSVPAPQPLDMTREQYYLPQAAPPATPTSQTHIESSPGASPVQQVLWVPSGL